MKISAKNLLKKYSERTVVSDITLTIEPGKILGLLGPNGAGKSTTIKMLSGQIKPNSGEISVDGTNYNYLPEELRTRIGIMPQDIIIWDDLSILENLQMSAALFNLTTERTKERIDFLIDALKLSPELHTLARNLSGGYKRRVNLAISVIHDPEVIFLDEPTPGIDAQSRLLLNEFVQSLADTGKYGIVLTDHYLDEAEKLCDSFVIIDNGKIVTEGTLAELKKRHGQGKFMEIELEETSKNKIEKLLLQEFPQGKVIRNTFVCLANDLLGTLSKATKLIEEQGLSIQNISIKEPSLEDIFLLITGRDLRE
jgi:ABC-2 type transport system ATP-binding protein